MAPKLADPYRTAATIEPESKFNIKTVYTSPGHKPWGIYTSPSNKPWRNTEHTKYHRWIWTAWLYAKWVCFKDPYALIEIRVKK